MIKPKNMKEKGAESSLGKRVVFKIQTKMFCSLKELLQKEEGSPIKIQGFEEA